MLWGKRNKNEFPNFIKKLYHFVNPSPLGGFPDPTVLRPQGENNGESLLEFRLRMTTSI